MKANVVWTSGLSFKGTAETGFTLPLGAHPNVGGDNDGFRPMELLGIGIAGCTAMDVISILHKKRQKVTSFEVSVSADHADEHPKVFTQLYIHYTIQGTNIDSKAVERAIELSETKYCPAQAMFKGILPIQLSFEINER
jgi:putative redox protein